jgi:hypothetical protein
MEPNGSSPHSQNTTTRPNLEQANPIHTFTPSLTNIHLTYSIPCISPGFLIKKTAYLISRDLHAETNKLNTPGESCVNCCLYCYRRKGGTTCHVQVSFWSNKIKSNKYLFILWTHKPAYTAVMYNGCESVKCNALWRCDGSTKHFGPKSIHYLWNALP